MERFILKKLLDWKNSPYRKPLILKGVRQVGKTWILKEFGRRCYENTAYFNFDAVQKKQRAVKRQSIIIRMTRSETGLLMRRSKMVSAKQNITTSTTIPTSSSNAPMQRSGAIREQPTAMIKMAI